MTSKLSFLNVLCMGRTTEFLRALHSMTSEDVVEACKARMERYVDSYGNYPVADNISVK